MSDSVNYTHKVYVVPNLTDPMYLFLSGIFPVTFSKFKAAIIQEARDIKIKNDADFAGFYEAKMLEYLLAFTDSHIKKLEKAKERFYMAFTSGYNPEFVIEQTDQKLITICTDEKGEYHLMKFAICTTTSSEQISNEGMVLTLLRGIPGIPNLTTYKNNPNYVYIIEQPVGASIEAYMTTIENTCPPESQKRLELVNKFRAQLEGVLDTIHKRGVIHRDVNPSNMIIADPFTEKEKLYLVDWGISTKVKTKIESPGSFYYITFETYNRKYGAIQDDLISLKLSLYHLYVGDKKWMDLHEDVFNNAKNTVFKKANSIIDTLIKDDLANRKKKLKKTHESETSVEYKKEMDKLTDYHTNIKRDANKLLKEMWEKEQMNKDSQPLEKFILFYIGYKQRFYSATSLQNLGDVDAGPVLDYKRSVDYEFELLNMLLEEKEGILKAAIELFS